MVTEHRASLGYVLSLLLVFLTAQTPPVPGETTLVSFCKQGRLSACEVLKEINPAKAAELMRGLDVAMAMEEAAKQAGEQQASEQTESAADASPEPPDCKGQEHHVISRTIAKKLEGHLTLGGLYKPRDKRFVAMAKDEDAHCGYQEWHRKVDQEVVEWLDKSPQATPEQFMRFLREIYKRSDMLERFPRGF
jgi:hypothetical protein